MTNIKHELNQKWIFCNFLQEGKTDIIMNRLEFHLKQRILRQLFFAKTNQKNNNCAIIKQYLQPNFLSQPLLEKTGHRLQKRPTYNPTLIQSILHTKLETLS